MLANNNQGVIRRMARRSLASSRRRTVIMGLAVALSAFMLFSVFTVGITWFHMYHLQNIRLAGGDFDAVMYGMTEEQREKCEENPDIDRIGIAAVAGSVLSTDYDNTVNVGCIWADDVYWNDIMAPARTQVKGSYPQEENEVMLTQGALETCGFEDMGLGIGDTFRALWQDGQGNQMEREFKISGIWEGYGSQNEFYVSKAFYDQCGYQLSEVASGRYFMTFHRNFWTQEEQTAFIDSMDLEKQQNIFFSVEAGYSIPIVLGLGGIALVTCLCACLLIYNILYLSVVGNVRYYGLLQTIGMTGRQIRALMGRQSVLVGGAGIAAGLLFGTGVSFFLIPSIIRFLGVRAKEAGPIEISFHPAVFLLTILLTGATVWIGSRKPVKLAVCVSPIEAAGYRPVYGGKSVRKTGKGRLLWRLALQQLTKDKRKSAVIILSLAAGFSVFLCLVTMIQSQGPRTYVSNFMDQDMEIDNETMARADNRQWKDILGGDFLERLSDTEGVSRVSPVLAAQITVPWEPDFADMWMREFYDMWMYIPYEDDLQEYKEHPENFGSFLVGITESDLDYLTDFVDAEIDREDFLAGKTCVLYRNSLELTDADVMGKTVTCGEYPVEGLAGEADAVLNEEALGNTCSFEIAGLTDESYFTGPMLGCPPVVIVSEQAVREFTDRYYVSKAAVQYKESYDEETESAVLSLMDASPDAKDFSYTSRIREAETVKSAQGNMMEVGIGVAAVLAFIGILNYINTVIGNIQSRKRELAALESIGMTDRQMRRMLVMEGLLVAAGSLLLVGTLGLGVTYVIYQSMNYMGADFYVPLWPVAGMAVFAVFICVLVPLACGRALMRGGSIVERIRAVE